MSEPWMFEMSKHSMRRGSTSRSSRSRSAAQDLLRLLARMAPLQVEGEPRVAHDQLQQPHLLARAAGTRMRTWRPAPRGQPGLQQLAVGHLRRDQHLARHVARPSRVELLDRRRTGSAPAPPRGRAGSPRGATTLPSRTENTCSAARSPLHVGPEEVALLEVGGGDLLRRLQALQGPDLVAQAGRLLEAIPRRRLLHLRAAAAAPPRPCAPPGTGARPRTAWR